MSAPPTGQQRRDEGVQHVENSRPDHVVRACRVLLGILLDRGQATADDVRAAMTMPPGVTPNLYGAAFQKLRKLGLIEVVGLTTSNRPARHAGINRVWQLTDAIGAQHWLTEHPAPAPGSSGSPGSDESTTEYNTHNGTEAFT